MTSETSVVNASEAERRTRAIGREIFDRVGRGPGPLDRAWWDDRAMALAMDDPQVKVQLFRFIDVLPTLRTADLVAGRLGEYLAEAGPNVPWWMRLATTLAPPGSPLAALLAWAARFSATHMAGRFIAGATPDQALRAVLKLRHKQLTFTADLLGEAVITDEEAEAYQATCVTLLDELSPRLASEAEVPLIDRDSAGPLPRVNLSLKLTSLTPRFDPIHAEATMRHVADRLRPILRVARERGAFVNVDMEQYAFKDLTYEIFKNVLTEPEFRDWPNVGIVCQAYLPEAEADLRSLLDWVETRGTPVTVRLVKGAYWDYEVTHARQVGWPVPVFLRKWETDASHERCADFLLDHADKLRPAFGSHNIRSVAHAMAGAEARGLPVDAYEIQMLHGMGESIQAALVAMGRRVRLYTPYGAILPGMAYLVRRLLENTSNDSFLKAGFIEHKAAETLLRDPLEIGEMLRAKRTTTTASAAPALPPFANEPPTDFHRPANREAFRAALAVVDRSLPRECPILIDGRIVEPAEDRGFDESRDPSRTEIVVGRTPVSGVAEARLAVETAARAFPAWAAAPARERASVLLRAAEILRRRRFELAAWQIRECGKPWREADADIAEAIDFCEFYAREMIRLDAGEARDVPGETNRVEHVARGVVAVIPPWNFPLAIPTGMTVAALVTGNAVVLKPAEQSFVTASLLAEILMEAGLPSGVLSFLPGPGEVVGQALVDDPRVSLISFTGSRRVGLEINRRAAAIRDDQDHVKRVIAEMGGKNAIIIDEDADLDEAVVGVLHSAFSYAGQKCSACSRVIVLDSVHDAFLKRLVAAAEAVKVGRADDPETLVGPVIEASAVERLRSAVERAEREGAKVVFAHRLDPSLASGTFFGPTILADVLPAHAVARDELFGPVVAVMRARDISDALAIAEATDYALTGGLYSRGPANIERVKREFRVGNLYINRSITGALVNRQPFGGFKLSGIGTKAGGSDYLREFLLTRVVTENTMRRGFAPE